VIEAAILHHDNDDTVDSGKLRWRQTRNEGCAGGAAGGKNGGGGGTKSRAKKFPSLNLQVLSKPSRFWRLSKSPLDQLLVAFMIGASDYTLLWGNMSSPFQPGAGAPFKPWLEWGCSRITAPQQPTSPATAPNFG
jgi:hypothetical protein